MTTYFAVTEPAVQGIVQICFATAALLALLRGVSEAEGADGDGSDRRPPPAQ